MQIGSTLLTSDRNLTLAGFAVGLATILGAWGFQIIGGYLPCEMCYFERIPYYLGLPVLAVLLLAWKRIPPAARLAATLAVFAIFAWSAYLGGFHAGVEWGLWPGPSSCTGLGNSTSGFSALGNLNGGRIVPCDIAVWDFLGISFAGYDGLISAFVALLLGLSSLGQIRKLRGA